METTTASDTPLKRWRTTERLTPQQAAERIGVTLPMWSRWENAVRDVPAIRVLDIEAKTGISRHDLRPDVFGAKLEAEPAKASAA